MRAYVVRHDDHGRSSRWEEVPDPSPSAEGVIVRVRAAALAWSDVLQMEGTYAGAVPDTPFVCGHEFAGEVVAAGSEAGYALGDRVFGFLPSPAAFAEYVAAPARCVRRTPDELADTDAAAFTTSFLTADAAMVTVGGLTPGRSLLVHAAAGGVGRSALQLARAYGTELILATAGSPSRRTAAEASGAMATADYDDFPDLVLEHTRGRGVDVVLESVGGDVFDLSARVLAPLGRLVTIGASSGTPPRRLKLPLLWQRSISVCGIHIARLLGDHPEVLQPSWKRLLSLLPAGRIRPEVGLTVSPADLAQGIEALRGRTVDGRVVIDFTGGVPV
ncbi:NADPH:quinone oxidoreductase family protein [Acrocarpospora sp. B8E8]|uniref:NADPH:quinone oxidoreductase family protein n=1 Tax=Acrocarpospora sp. B8E8 TaxID=3153572 RepID=UPI00325EA825